MELPLVSVEADLEEPKNMKLPPLLPRNTDPKFFLHERGWLDDTVSHVWKQFQAEPDLSDKVQPLALVRCSKGGKTRTISEIAHRLKRDRPNVVVISISNNDQTRVSPLEDDPEQLDPLGALCRRIAFAVMKGRDFEQSSQFAGFRKRVTPKHIRQWLGDETPEGAPSPNSSIPCVLLVDELNALQRLRGVEDSKENPEGKRCAQFLRDVFVKPRNRYLIISSHTLKTKTLLGEFMEVDSLRPVWVRGLPLIPSLEKVAEELNCPELTARKALYYGLIPALLYQASTGCPISDKAKGGTNET